MGTVSYAKGLKRTILTMFLILLPMVTKTPNHCKGAPKTGLLVEDGWGFSYLVRGGPIKKKVRSDKPSSSHRIVLYRPPSSTTGSAHGVFVERMESRFSHLTNRWDYAINDFDLSSRPTWNTGICLRVRSEGNNGVIIQNMQEIETANQEELHCEMWPYNQGEKLSGDNL